jgi:hypothetical protein
VLWWRPGLFTTLCIKYVSVSQPKKRKKKYSCFSWYSLWMIFKGPQKLTVTALDPCVKRVLRPFKFSQIGFYVSNFPNAPNFM